MDNPALDLQGAEILIVDDVPDNVRLLSNTLSEQSYRVRGVTSGSMAVLEVIDQVMDLDRAVIYLQSENAPKLVAAMDAPGERVPHEALAQRQPSPELQQAFAALVQDPRPVATPEGLAVPIARGDELLGCMVVGRDDHQPNDAELKTLSSFALQAAVAINDALVQQDSGDWTAHLADALKVDDSVSLDDLHDQAGKDA